MSAMRLCTDCRHCIRRFGGLHECAKTEHGRGGFTSEVDGRYIAPWTEYHTCIHTRSILGCGSKGRWWEPIGPPAPALSVGRIIAVAVGAVATFILVLQILQLGAAG